MWNLIYLCSIGTDDGKCNTEIQGHIRIEKDAFQRLRTVLRDWKMSLKTNKKSARVLYNI